MSVERLRTLMPERDYGIRNYRGCVWKYGVKLRDDTGNGKVYDVGFDGKTEIVRSFGEGDDFFEFVQH